MKVTKSSMTKPGNTEMGPFERISVKGEKTRNSSAKSNQRRDGHISQLATPPPPSHTSTSLFTYPKTPQ